MRFLIIGVSMFIYDVLEIGSIVVAGLFFLTQIVIPIWRGTILFPNFCSESRKLSRELSRVKLEIELMGEKDNLEKLKQRLDKKEEKV